MYGIDRVQRLVAQKIVVLRRRRDSNEPVVIPAITEQQKIFGSFGRGRSTVIKHLHKPAVCRNIGSSRRELVINLLCSDHLYRNAIHLPVGCRKTLCRREEIAVRRHYYNHIDLPERMQVLVLYFAEILNRGEFSFDVEDHKIAVVPCRRNNRIDITVERTFQLPDGSYIAHLPHARICVTAGNIECCVSTVERTAEMCL